MQRILNSSPNKSDTRFNTPFGSVLNTERETQLKRAFVIWNLLEIYVISKNLTGSSILVDGIFQLSLRSCSRVSQPSQHPFPFGISNVQLHLRFASLGFLGPQNHLLSILFYCSKPEIPLPEK